jgi:membrane fusion protein, multidrug efflux system
MMRRSTPRLIRFGGPLVLLGFAGLALAQSEITRQPASDQGKVLQTQKDQAPAKQVQGSPGQGPQGQRPGGGAPPVTVTAVEIRPRSVRLDFSAIGTVQPIASVALKPRIDSQVVSIAVEEGALVKAGDLLVTLDDRQLRAQLAQIDAQVAKDDAQIAQAERDVLRTEDLLERKIGTQVLRDTSATNLKALKAQREADLAQSLNVRTQLGFTELRAPVNGRIGSIAAKPGAVVRAADTAPIATINQIDPIYVAVALPQSMLPNLKEAMARGPVPVGALAGQSKASGKVAFVENGVDAATGTVMVKARMENAAEMLWPGAFVRVTLTLGDSPDALTVPLAALQPGQSGPYVFVIDENGRARIAQVSVARTAGDLAVITAGIVAGDRVITSGQLRLANGTPVRIEGAAPRKGPAENANPAESKNQRPDTPPASSSRS